MEITDEFLLLIVLQEISTKCRIYIERILWRSILGLIFRSISLDYIFITVDYSGEFQEGPAGHSPLSDAKKLIFMKKELIIRKEGVKKWFSPLLEEKFSKKNLLPSP